MSITVFSLFMAVLWCNIFIFAIVLVRKNTGFIFSFSLVPLLLLFGICLSRLLFCFDFPYTRVITSDTLLPAIFSFFKAPWIHIGVTGISISLLNCIVVIWLIGSLYFIGKYIFCSITMTRILRAQKPTDDLQVNRILKEVVEDSKKIAHTKVILFNANFPPMIAGFFRPIIVLPKSSFEDNTLRMILAHEWQHFLHKDAWLKLLMYMVCGVFWWNPCMHLMRANLNHTLEMRCDLALIAQMETSSKIEYAKLLLQIFEEYSWSKGANERSVDYSQAYNISAFLSAKKESMIEQRINLILNFTHKKKRILGTFLVCATAITIFLGSTMFVIQPAYQPTVERGFDQCFLLTEEKAYLLDLGSGTYQLYVGGEYKGDIDERIVKEAPFNSLPIQ